MKVSVRLVVAVPLALLLAVAGLTGCSGGRPSGTDGIIAVVDTVRAPTDVANVRVDVVRSAEACTTPPVTSVTVPRSSTQDVVTALFTVAAGAYRVCGTGLTSTGAPSASVGVVEGMVNVSAGTTAQLTLTLAAGGNDGGAGDGGGGTSGGGVGGSGGGVGGNAAGTGGRGGGSGAGGTSGAGGALGTGGSAGRGGAAGNAGTAGAGGASGAGGGAGNAGASGAGATGGAVTIAEACGSGVVLSGDFDCDGTKDCVAWDATSLHFHKGLGGGMADAGEVLTGCAQKGTLYQVVDLNGDGCDDILNEENVVSIPKWQAWLDTGGPDGRFDCSGAATGPYLPQTEYLATCYPPCDRFAVGDFDGDGLGDVWMPFFSMPGNNILDEYMFTGVRGTNMVVPKALGGGTLTGYFGSIGNIVSGDFNGDKVPDIFYLLNIQYQIGPSPGRKVYLFSEGPGTWGTTNQSAMDGATALAASDVNGDGHLDLVVTVSGVPTTFYGDGAGNLLTTAP